MKFTTKNVQVSLTVHLAEYFRSKGWNIFWDTSGTLESHTSGLPEDRGTISVVRSIPANPQYITRLKDGETYNDLAAYEVAVPVFSLTPLGMPKRPQRQGIGHSDFFWMREFRVDLLASNEDEWKVLADALFDWGGNGDRRWTIYDYEADPANPVPLEPIAKKEWCDIRPTEIIGVNDEARYYVRLLAAFEYVE